MRLLRKRLGKPHPYLTTLGDRLATDDFKDRLVPRYPTASSQETRPAAEAETLPASAAFSSFAEASEDRSSCFNSCPDTANPRQDPSSEARSAKEDQTAPASPAQAIGAVAPSFAKASEGMLSEASAFILSLIAAHEGRSDRDIVAELIAAAGIAIGLSPLLRDADGIPDLAEVPDFARAAANRFRGGGP